MVWVSGKKVVINIFKFLWFKDIMLMIFNVVYFLYILLFNNLSRILKFNSNEIFIKY